MKGTCDMRGAMKRSTDRRRVRSPSFDEAVKGKLVKRGETFIIKFREILVLGISDEILERDPDFNPVGSAKLLQKVIESVTLTLDDDEEEVSLDEIANGSWHDIPLKIKQDAEEILKTKHPDETFRVTADEICFMDWAKKDIKEDTPMKYEVPVFAENKFQVHKSTKKSRGRKVGVNNKVCHIQSLRAIKADVDHLKNSKRTKITRFVPPMPKKRPFRSKTTLTKIESLGNVD